MRKILGIALLLIVLGPFAALAAYFGYLHGVQSPRYAGQYFDGLVDIQKVEASRRWHRGAHPWAGRAFGCTFAIATLPENASSDPPVGQKHRRFPFDWPNAWEQTPAVTKDGHHAILDECAYLLPAALVIRLRAAHDAAGSFYSVGQEKLFLYAPDHQLVARIRFGD